MNFTIRFCHGWYKLYYVHTGSLFTYITGLFDKGVTLSKLPFPSDDVYTTINIEQ